jgi:hypothetical protein
MRKRAAREAQAKLAAVFAVARADMETEEGRKRALVEQTAAAAGYELGFEFFHALVAPRSRFMIPRTLFDDLKRVTHENALRATAHQLDLERRQRELEQQNIELRDELRAMRRDYRTLGQAVDLHCRREQSAVLAALQDCVRSLDAAITQHRADCSESPHLLNRALEESRLAHRDFVRRALDAAAGITVAYQRATIAHTRIPRRIRDQLRHATDDDLLLLLDTLSFEDGVLQFLLYRFPPPAVGEAGDADEPFAW